MRSLLIAVLLAAGAAHAAPDPNKVFRYAISVAETSLDPQKISDLYSGIINNGIFDTPLKYDYLARPLKLKPNTLVAMPEITDGGKTYTLRVKPGIYFADDPVFKGVKRELTAHDYVYSIKRLMDPRLSAPLLAQVEHVIAHTDEPIARARKANRFDYDTPIEGLKALDRYTLQIKLQEPIYNFIYNLADCRVSCAVAREVVEHYGDDIGSHPVGTGPYQVDSWTRSSKLVFKPNPNFREEYFDGEPAPDDVKGQEILAKMKGRRLPMVGRVEVYIIEETQPRWLAFLNNEMDLLWELPPDYAYQAIPNGKLAPNLARRGIRMDQVPALDLTFNYFNMEDPVVGGFAPEKVALRRAISLGYKTTDEIAIIRKNQAILAHTPYSPGVAGYDPNFTTTANEYNVPKAKALLDMFGYVDRDGDGYREAPDGSRLEIRGNSTPTARDKELDELWRRSMDDIGIRITFRKAKWPDLLKESNAGKLQFWQLGGAASSPDADTWLQTLWGPNAGFKGNRSRFKHPDYDRLYEQARLMPHGPERTRVYQEMTKIVVAYAPLKINTHRILTDLWYPYVVGFRRPLVTVGNWWKYIDIERP